MLYDLGVESIQTEFFFLLICNENSTSQIYVSPYPHFISGHEQTQLNRVCYFHLFGSLLPKDLTIQN